MVVDDDDDEADDDDDNANRAARDGPSHGASGGTSEAGQSSSCAGEKARLLNRKYFNIDRAKAEFPWIGKRPASDVGATAADELAAICEWCRESATESERSDACLRRWIDGVTGFKNFRGKDGKLAKHAESRLHIVIAKRRAMDAQAKEVGTLQQQLHGRPVTETQKQFNRRQLDKLTYLLVRTIHLDHAHSDCLSDAAEFQSTCMGDLELATFTSQGNASYTSKETTALLLRELAGVIERPTIEAIRASPYTVIQADGSTDSAGLEQFVIAMRYWSKSEMHEKFCALRNLREGTAEYLESILCEFFAQKGIDIEKLVFQVYDGCNTNKGHKSGLQVRIRKRAKLALFVHCRAHKLQLAVCDAVHGVEELELLFELTGKIWTYYRKSYVQWSGLKAMAREYRLHLMALHKAGETRWTSHTAAVRSVIIDYDAIVCHLARKPKKDFKAAGMLAALLRPSTRIMLVAVKSVFELLEEFQKKMMRDASNFLSYEDDVAQLVRDLDRVADAASVDRIYSHDIVRAVTAEDMSVEGAPLLSVPVRDGATLAEVHRVIEVLLPPVMDFVATRLKGDQAPIIQALAIFAPKVLLSDVNVDAQLQVLFEFYGEAVHASDAEQLERHFKLFRDTFRNSARLTKELTLPDFMKTEHLLPGLAHSAYQLAIIAIMCPISSVFSERMFSKMKLIKTYLRGRLSGDSLESLMRIRVHLNSLPMARWHELVQPAVDEFVRGRPHRLEFATST